MNVEAMTKYLVRVQCEYCGSEVYPHEDDARATVEHWIEFEDVHDIDDLRARVERTCDGCAHMMDGYN